MQGRESQGNMSADLVAEVQALSDRSLFLSAYRAAQASRPLSEWVEPRPACVAARLATHLGARRLATRLIARAARLAPNDPLVRFWYSVELQAARGPLATWLYLRGYDPPPESNPQEIADIAMLKVRLLAAYRDFATAERLLKEIDQHALGIGDWAATHSYLLMRQDRYAEALEVVQVAIADHPQARLAVQQAAQLLELLGRGHEALDILAAADERMESASVIAQRASLEYELGLFEEQQASLERFAALSPLLDQGAKQEYAGLRASNAYRRGDLEAARRWGGQALPWFERFCERLNAPAEPTAQRKQLQVRAVVQEHLGCAPATLAMLARYFGDEVDQIEVADQICYEGTAAHSERRWASERGWLELEFTANFDIARELIDRGVPFGIVTVDIASAHMQAVVGYDARLRTLLLRDPMSCRTLEAHSAQFFEQYAPYGPRAIVLLPPTELERLNGLTLPEQALHDVLYRLQLALDAHDRERAEQELANLKSLAPNHRLYHWGCRALKSYDADPYAVQAASEALLELFPAEPNAVLSVLGCLRETGAPTSRTERLEALVAEKSSLWVYREALAQELVENARSRERARRLIQGVLRQAPMRAQTLALAARLSEADGNRGLALEQLRLAACLEPTSADLASAYFERAYWQGEAEAGLAFLRSRAERYLKRSYEPTAALFQALTSLDRVEEAFEWLARALTARPDDELLLLFAAEAHARYEHGSRAYELLESARRQGTSSPWLRSAARVADALGELTQAMDYRQQLVDREPLDVANQEAYCNLLVQLKGPDAARRHLDQVCTAHPHHLGLAGVRAMFLRGHDPAEVVRALETLLELQPANAWALRELALTRSAESEHERALELAERAADIAPDHPASWMTLECVQEGRREYAQAESSAERACELWVDAPGAVATFMRLGATYERRHERLNRLEAMVTQRSVDGTALLAWGEEAVALLGASAALKRLRRLRQARPDSWSTWHLSARALLSLERGTDAKKLLRRAVRRFPHKEVLWLDMADTHALLGDFEAEVEAAEQAATVASFSPASATRLAEAHVRSGDLDAARSVLGRGLRRNPASFEIREQLAWLSWRAGESEQAVSALERALQREPNADEGWATLARWCVALGDTARPIGLARALSRERPWNAQIWQHVASVSATANENQAALEALEEALKRNPSLVSALDLKAVVLTRLGQRQAALETCRSQGRAGRAAASLRGREAWVLAQFGDFAGAIQRLRALLKDFPEYIWAWQQLVEYLLETEARDEAIAAAKGLVRNAPLDGASYGILAETQLAAGQTKRAFKTLFRALEVSPSYLYAAHKLIDMSLQAGDSTSARRVLALAGHHAELDLRATWEVRVAARSDATAAREAFTRLLELPVADEQLLEQARQALRSNEDETALADSLFQSAQAPHVNPETGALWLRTVADTGRLPTVRKLAMLAEAHPAAGQCALRELYSLLGDRCARYRVLWWYWRSAHLARSNDVTWGKLGYALTSCRWYILCARWLSDYRERKNAEAWMLFNLASCLMHNHRMESSYRVALHALCLRSDDTLLSHLARAGFFEATHGRFDEAARHVNGIQPETADDTTSWMLRVAQALVQVAQLREEPAARAAEQFELELLIRERGWLGTAFWSPHATCTRMAARAAFRLRPSISMLLMGWSPLWLGLLAYSYLYLVRYGNSLIALTNLVTVYCVAYLVTRLRR